jgi:hypothetical protein
MECRNATVESSDSTAQRSSRVAKHTEMTADQVSKKKNTIVRQPIGQWRPEVEN